MGMGLGHDPGHAQTWVPMSQHALSISIIKNQCTKMTALLPMLAFSSSSAFTCPLLKYYPNLVTFEHHVLYSTNHHKNYPTVLLPMTFLN